MEEADLTIHPEPPATSRGARPDLQSAFDVRAGDVHRQREQAPKFSERFRCFLHLDPILVCGAPRTGTSWTAKILTRGGNVRYFREPFSHGGFADDHGVAGYPYYRAGAVPPAYERAWKRVFSFEPLQQRRWLMADSRGRLQRTAFWPARLLIKEVNCILALDWLADRHPLRILITIRHPCGYVASALRIHAAGEVVAELDDLRSQPAVMAEFSDVDREWIMGLRDPVAQLAAAYGIVYKIIGDQLISHPEWAIVQHEALCLDPRTAFRRLSQLLDLRYTRDMDALLSETTCSRDTATYSVRRVSSEEPDKWKHELTSAQIDTVAEVVSRFKLRFYRDFA